MTEEKDTILKVRNLSKTFGSITALQNFSLNVEEGEFLSVIGPSGSGKTTLLKILAGVLDATTGQIQYEGIEIGDIDPRKQGLVMVWQSLALFPHMTVRKNVEFGLSVCGMEKSDRDKLLDEALSMVGLENIESRRIHELSGGQQQRVALARALVVKPKVLLLDEPMGSLDAHLRTQLQAQLRSLHMETKITFIMVTHDQGEALALSDRIAIMNEGRVEQVNSPHEVLSRPLTPFVAQFIGNNNVLPCKVISTSESRVTVSSSLGELTGKHATWADRPVVVGNKAAYVIGSSRIESGAEQDNIIAGKVDNQLMLGSLITVLLRHAGGHVIKWEIHGTKASKRLQGMAEIEVSWRAEDAFVLPLEVLPANRKNA